MAHVGEELALGPAGGFCGLGHALELPIAFPQFLRHRVQKGRHALGQGDDVPGRPLAAGIGADLQMGLPFPHAHGHQGAVQDAAFAVMTVNL